jgi:hypothetical protein
VSGCSNIEPNDPIGFGVWDNNCNGIAVAVNQSDWDSGLFMNHEVNERYDLYLCDTLGKKIKTVFESRTINGSPAWIDSMDYDVLQGFLVVYSTLYGTGNYKREKINVSTLEIVEEEILPNTTMRHNIDTRTCNNKRIYWDYPASWIKLE